ncbi:flagellar assembly protein FliW [Cellulomonas sp. URHB0016]
MNLAPETVRVAVAGSTCDVPADLHLVEPIPGLPGRTHYALDALDDAATLFALRSVPDGDESAREVRLFVVSPTLYFPDYQPVVDASSLGEHTDPADVVLLVVVHPGTGDSAPTANLLAPVLVDRRTGRAVQSVLDEDWPLRAPVG